jgi:hypothetical protein
MLALILTMLVSVGLALAVLVVVAVPARRAGRDLLTERGEEVVDSLRHRTQRVRPATEGTEPGALEPAAPPPN